MTADARQQRRRPDPDPGQRPQEHRADGARETRRSGSHVLGEQNLAGAEDRRLGAWTPRKPTPSIVRGEGCELIAANGDRYLDLTAGYGVCSLGYNHPAMVEALTAQAKRLTYCPMNMPSEDRARYVEALAAVLPDSLDRVFLCNSGTEAVEGALKFAALATGRSRTVALRNSFHGRTLGAQATMWNPAARKPYAGLLHDNVFVQPEVDAIDEAVDGHTAALILEPVQGEGGVRVLSDDVLLAARASCDRHGALLILDEVQTGFGRCGSWFAHRQTAGLEPDLMTLAKGIGGGFPLGAIAYGERVAAALRPGCHGSTYGGNPLACAAGLAVIRTMASLDLPARAATLGARFLDALRDRLASHPLVREVRGRGLMLGVVLRQRAGRHLSRLTSEHRILALAAGPNVIRMLPPLIVGEAELERAVNALDAVLQEP